MSWTDERVETLKRMWGEGQSASQIAKELGGVTRNAVIGKVHRLGLSNRGPGEKDEETVVETVEEIVVQETVIEVTVESVPEPEPEPVRAEPSRIEPQPRVAPPPPTQLSTRRPVTNGLQPLPPQPSTNEISPETLASAREVEKRARKLTLLELTERTCKWPIGDPATEDFWFCGHAAAPGKPYCEAHVSVAFQPMSARRDRRR
ncbi:GcrA cell cycle regulator [Haematobacter massiliensis]|uniref:GcrA cell cycle regulator n=1 Tax=Haematobacter massiliensis TaxID=195105 RepID=A0A086XX52_9RHOB|nr:GcrA family cell cycle regulator [Haematobacter massiliensis]KFI26602.1 GcrA cell cycle regulator [Haematobacter massiliensis]OWJ73296.1 GcrA cell cycle regulator [Haematobacter massiliensis]OWJ86347.1 GcrA cell cycle regulator [Haematobacter massiliensis]QBJ23905.1 GcrA cell cycle regulator [Haematobacter massiliensis]